MPIVLDHGLREQISYDLTEFPVVYFCNELADLGDLTGPIHWHPEFEIATATIGALDFQVGTEHVVLNPGDSIFVNGNVMHGIRQISEGRTDPVPNIVFAGSAIAPEDSMIYKKYISPIACCDELSCVVFNRKSGWHDDVNRMAKSIYQSMDEKKPCYEMSVQRSLSEIFERIFSNLAGPCLFAVFMGTSRVFYGKMSEKLDLIKAMLACGVLCAVCYLAASLSAVPIVGLAGCALCGISVGIMWPGTISLSSQKCPKGGTAMFAFLALAGDLGATLSPAIVGSISDAAGGNLKTGLLAATVFPLVLIVGLIAVGRKFKNPRSSETANS